MGSDIVDFVLRCEEVFGVSLDDEKLGWISTVGEFFELICAELHLPTGHGAPELPGINHLSKTLNLRPWTREDVWATVVALLVREWGVDLDEIRYEVNVVDDLGI